MFEHMHCDGTFSGRSWAAEERLARGFRARPLFERTVALLQAHEYTQISMTEQDITFALPNLVATREIAACMYENGNLEAVNYNY